MKLMTYEEFERLDTAFVCITNVIRTADGILHAGFSGVYDDLTLDMTDEEIEQTVRMPIKNDLVAVKRYEETFTQEDLKVAIE